MAIEAVGKTTSKSEDALSLRLRLRLWLWPGKATGQEGTESSGAGWQWLPSNIWENWFDLILDLPLALYTILLSVQILGIYISNTHFQSNAQEGVGEGWVEAETRLEVVTWVFENKLLHIFVRCVWASRMARGEGTNEWKSPGQGIANKLI